MRTALKYTLVFLAIFLFTGAATAQQTAARPQQKVLKDPSEYNAYMSATNQIDPNAKANALEAFLEQYPNTVIKEETLEQLLAAYQAVGDPAKMNDTANSLFYMDPDNLRAIAVLVVHKQAEAKSLGSIDPQQVARLRRDAAELAKRGLRVIGNTPRSPGADNDFYDLAKLLNGALSTSNDSAKK